MRRKFYKYQGAGNDFVLLDARDSRPDLSRETVAALCDRHFGIGADGLMALEPAAEGGEFYMRYFNADGGESTMCGNGGRCIALFAHHLGIGGTLKRFDSSDGVHEAEILEADGDRGRVRLRMADVEGCEARDNYFFLNTGSPHYVEFVDDVDAVDVYGRGRAIRYSDAFAAQGGTNVNFVQLLPDGNFRIRTYERGVEDETLACGTGATACALAVHLACYPSRREFRVYARGGELKVSFEKAAGQRFTDVWLEGPAVRVFECEADADGWKAQRADVGKK
mgnify:CR=1 FL=1